MVGDEGCSAGSYLSDPTCPIPSHCAVIILFESVSVHQLSRLALQELSWMSFMSSEVQVIGPAHSSVKTCVTEIHGWMWYNSPEMVTPGILFSKDIHYLNPRLDVIYYPYSISDMLCTLSRPGILSSHTQGKCSKVPAHVTWVQCTHICKYDTKE